MLSSTLKPAEDRGLLRQVADAEARALIHRQVRDVVAVELDLALVGLDQPGDHVEHRGLAGAVRPEQPDRLTAPQREAHALHDLAADEALLNAVDRERTGLADDRRELARALRFSEHAFERTRGWRLRGPLEQRGWRGRVAIDAILRLGGIAPQVGRRNRLPVEIALRTVPDRLRRNALALAERHALGRGEIHLLGMAIGHRLGDRAEIDAPERWLRRRRSRPSAAKRLEKIQHAVSMLPKSPQP